MNLRGRVMFGVVLCVITICLVGASEGRTIPVAKDKKPAPAPAAEDGNALRVDGIQPLFLDADPAVQSVLIVGAFPKDTNVVPGAGIDIPHPETTQQNSTQILVEVQLADPSNLGDVLLDLESQTAGAPVSVTLMVRPACQSTSPARSPNYDAPGGTSLCDTTGGTIAVNALTKAVTMNLASEDKEFCKPSHKGSSLDVRKTYRHTNSSTAVMVCDKNPFKYSTQVVVKEQVIQDDDLTTFLGILVPTLGASKAADSATKGASGKSTAKTMSVPNLRKPAAPVQIRDSVQACLGQVATHLRDVEQDYSNFLAQYAGMKAKLEDDNEECSTKVTDAQTLWKQALGLTASTKLRAVSQDVTTLLAEIDQRVALATASEYAKSDLTKSQTASLLAAKDALKIQYCIAHKTQDLISQNVGLKVLNPLTAILGDNESFVYTTPPLGPYQQPTSVDWVVQSTAIQSGTDKSQSLSDASDLAQDPFQACFTQPEPQKPTPEKPAQKPPETPAQPNPASSQAFRSWTPINASYDGSGFPWPQNGTGDATNQQKGKTPKKPTSPSAPAPAPQQSKTQEATQLGHGTLTYGGPRFIVSAGVFGVALRQQEFQKAIGQALDSSGHPIQGQSAVNTIQYKTNSFARISPMILAHARLYSYTGSDKAIWGTVGVTGKPDNQGTSPEYLFGISQSFWDNWVFLTGGLYVGMKQSLTPGLYVGQAVPSSLTGDIPVQKNYKAGFGFGVSFRIPKSDAPKTNSKKPSAPGNQPTSKQGTSQ